MKKALQPEPALQPEFVVAVPSLMPEFAVWNAATQELKTVYGGNIAENSVYVAGDMPLSFRIAAEEESFENELIIHPLPRTIEELVLSENPECQLVIAKGKLIELPFVEPKVKQGCIILKHPAVPDAYQEFERIYFKKKAHELKKKAARNKDPNQLFMLFEKTETPPLTPNQLSA